MGRYLYKYISWRHSVDVIHYQATTGHTAAFCTLLKLTFSNRIVGGLALALEQTGWWTLPYFAVTGQ